ncbi:UDP-4-amino-4,6-dideoxy-N-acetyl-beta-L-altrosamine transaminase [Campylobacter gastrosuis]|uniref:UDP-4-amino-4,6-dideoxy-N-acetyl-beta-L-altrosamine transaminase n=1 Tax=Campylobacter gastrosuis TaxID=2974576 RepID=A0ABT7HQ87_9BACT|nr:UDP-4-amino-4,6-dideoxy-N-acetyl-beta-L-altrosamine transaminase [Campylobacter gastrosuis]MDL0089005.1 UDP-4-amino-4,6-dideoxy-N-acetyl-beta-L-altrosamine transaminase [Campylobacter gastrosuis]
MIPYSRQQITNADIQAVCEALRGDFLTGGDKVSEFEKALQNYTGIKHVVVMNSATSALHVAYLIFGVKSGDDVITTPLTFVATANAALMCGADVKFCDIKMDGNIDEKLIENLITKRTKVITAVDFGGKSVEILKLKEIAKRHGIFLLDDASHALGSEFNGEKVGNHADISIFSFHAIKPITTFEGGAIATNSDEFARLARLYRSHGITKTELWDSDMSLLGFNYRLSDVACALGISQLKRLDEMIETREKVAKFYDECFKNCEFFTLIKPEFKSSRHLYAVLLDEKLVKFKREIFKELYENGVGVQVHYKPTYKFSFYTQKYGTLSLKNAENFYARELSLPCHQGMSEADAKFVAKNVLEILEKFAKRA